MNSQESASSLLQQDQNLRRLFLKKKYEAALLTSCIFQRGKVTVTLKINTVKYPFVDEFMA